MAGRDRQHELLQVFTQHSPLCQLGPQDVANIRAAALELRDFVDAESTMIALKDIVCSVQSSVTAKSLSKKLDVEIQFMTTPTKRSHVWTISSVKNNNNKNFKTAVVSIHKSMHDWVKDAKTDGASLVIACTVKLSPRKQLDTFSKKRTYSSTQPSADAGNNSIQDFVTVANQQTDAILKQCDILAQGFVKYWETSKLPSNNMYDTKAEYVVNELKTMLKTYRKGGKNAMSIEIQFICSDDDTYESESYYISDDTKRFNRFMQELKTKNYKGDIAARVMIELPPGEPPIMHIIDEDGRIEQDELTEFDMSDFEDEEDKALIRQALEDVKPFVIKIISAIMTQIQGGGRVVSDKVKVLGRQRKLVLKGRTAYVKVEGTLITLSEAKRREKSKNRC